MTAGTNSAAFAGPTTRPGMAKQIGGCLLDRRATRCASVARTIQTLYISTERTAVHGGKKSPTRYFDVKLVGEYNLGDVQHHSRSAD